MTGAEDDKSGPLRGNDSASGRAGRNGLMRLCNLCLGFVFLRRRLKKSTPPRAASRTETIMPAIAPAERWLCEEEVNAVSVKEVRLGRVAKVENDGWNVM